MRSVAAAECVLVEGCEAEKAGKRVLLVEVLDVEEGWLASGNCLVQRLFGEDEQGDGGGCAADFVAGVPGGARGAVLSEWCDV